MPKFLGKQVTFPETYDKELLDPIENSFNTDMVIELVCNEFTALCPITGQPDFAKIYIWYKPDNYIIESKSLKLYLGSFRNYGIFHEKVVDTIATDLDMVLEPKFIVVKAYFMPRGGISINPRAAIFRDKIAYQDFLKQNLEK